MRTVSRADIGLIFTSGCGVSREHCAILGWSFPPTSGWRKRVVGVKLTDEQYDALIELSARRRSMIGKWPKKTVFQSAPMPPPVDFVSSWLTPGFGPVRDFQVMMDAYKTANREAVAKAARALPYRDFLKTPMWRTVADAVKRRAGYRCQLCNAKDNLQAHHRSYDARGYEPELWATELTCLCAACHSKHHDKAA